MADEFDVVVIGGGPAGENVAGRVRAGGLTAAVVESELVGGECSYWACMPSKALLRPQEALSVAQRVPSLRGAITGGIDVARALRARNAFASNWNDEGQVQWLASVDATLVRGHGRITGERTVSVTGSDGEVQELTARKAVVVATGTGAAMPPIEGLAESEPWDSRKVVATQEVPERLIILGGGVIGVEMAQAWRSLGSEVTIVELQDRLLPVEEPAAGEFVAKAFESRGIEVRTGQGVTKVSRDGGTVTATLADGSTVEGTEIVVAVGRAANTRDIGLDSVGLTPGRYIDVDDTLVVSTDQLLGNLTGTEGNAVSDRHTVVETYRRVDDDIGPALEMTMVVNDPDYLASPWEIRWTKYYVADYEFTELDCRLPFFANQ